MADEKEVDQSPAEGDAADDPASVDDPVARHPLADRIRRAIEAHPILRDEKKLVVSVDGGRASVDGSVFTISMYNQLVELVSRIAGDQDVSFDVVPQIQPPQNRKLEGRVPGVSEGPSPIKRDYSINRRPSS